MEKTQSKKQNNKTKPSLFMQLNNVQCTNIHTHTNYILDDMCVTYVRTFINTGALDWYSHHQVLFDFVILP